MFTVQQWYYCCFPSEATQPIMTSLYEAMTSNSLVPCELSVLCYLITLHKNSQGQTLQWTLPALGETRRLRLEELPPKPASCSLHPSGMNGMKDQGKFHLNSRIISSLWQGHVSEMEWIPAFLRSLFLRMFMAHWKGDKSKKKNLIFTQCRI